MEESRNKKKWYRILFPVILMLYPLRHIWLGVELTDSAYSAGNYLYLEKMNPMWLFSTYLANETGHVLSGLPGGGCLMGLNAYTALIISILAVSIYFFLTRWAGVKAEIAFGAQLLAISLCWCPTTILYNTMTYLFLNGAVAFLYVGLIREKRSLLFLAGVLLGFNLFVRFPNIAEGLLIITVWYYGFLMHKRIRDVLEETGICILGFVAGAGIILLQIASSYGLTAYLTGIESLMNMPSNASDYSVYSMILTVLLDYKASARWLICMVLLAAAGLLLFSIAKEKGLLFKKLLFLAGVAGLFLWWYKLGVFNLKYYTYESMFQWVAVFLLVTIAFCLYDLFSDKVTQNQKLMALAVLVILAVTPLGSNNHLYPNINNTFLVFPFTLTSIYQLFYGRMIGDDLIRGRFSKATWKLRGHRLATFPAAAMLLLFAAAVVVQSLGFGAVFTFRDGMSGQKRNTKIENNVILKNMVTNQELADELDGLTSYVNQEKLDSRRVILYGQIPALSYFLQMEPAISTSWPDLRSYDINVMKSDLQKITDRPVIIISAKIDAYLTEDAEGMSLTKVTNAELESYGKDQKLRLLTDYMAKNNYQETYANEAFVIYE